VTYEFKDEKTGKVIDSGIATPEKIQQEMAKVNQKKVDKDNGVVKEENTSEQTNEQLEIKAESEQTLIIDRHDIIH
jgi:hypothetical protein